MNISNKPCHCQCRNTDYWKDDTLRDANMCRVFWGFFLWFFFYYWRSSCQDGRDDVPFTALAALIPQHHMTWMSINYCHCHVCMEKLEV